MNSLCLSSAAGMGGDLADLRPINQRLLQQFPRRWEAILTLDCLEEPLFKLWMRSRSLVPAPGAAGNPGEAAGSLAADLGGYAEAVRLIPSLLDHRLMEAWGAPGVPGDAGAIRAVCAQLLNLTETMFEHARHACAMPTPPAYLSRVHALARTCEDHLGAMVRLLGGLRQHLENPAQKVEATLHLHLGDARFGSAPPLPTGPCQETGSGFLDGCAALAVFCAFVFVLTWFFPVAAVLLLLLCAMGRR